jgi:hypothetical protein
MEWIVVMMLMMVDNMGSGGGIRAKRTEGLFGGTELYKYNSQ